MTNRSQCHTYLQITEMPSSKKAPLILEAIKICTFDLFALHGNKRQRTIRFISRKVTVNYKNHSAISDIPFNQLSEKRK